MKNVLTFAIASFLTSNVVYAQEHFCDLKITGAATANLHILAPKDSAQLAQHGASSDYWMSRENLEAANKAMDQGLEKLTGTKQPTNDNFRSVAEPLVLNCGTNDGSTSLNFMPAKKSTNANVPLKAKHYKVNPFTKAAPGEFGALISVNKAFLEVVGPGTLDIKQFDDKGIKGSFNVKAKGASGEVTISGSFNYPCVGGGCAK